MYGDKVEKTLAYYPVLYCMAILYSKRKFTGMYESLKPLVHPV